MARTISQLRNAHSRLPMITVATVLLLVSIAAPARWLGFVKWFGDLAEKLLIPVQGPVASAAGWMVGRVKNDEETPALADARSEAARFKTLYLQAEDEIARLRDNLDALQKGMALNPSQGVRLLMAAVIGESGGGSKVLKVRAGSSAGVSAGDVAAYDGVHLVGRVMEKPDPLFCRVLMITDSAAGAAQGSEGKGRVTGVIIPGETDLGLPPDPMAERIKCTLSPETGVLKGQVHYTSPRADKSAARVEAGAIVRLSDERWPASAQMLVLGRVERVETQPNGRQVVVVAPFYDSSVMREVTIRIDGEPGAGGAP